MYLVGDTLKNIITQAQQLAGLYLSITISDFG